jgi:hypothetical protein
VVDCRSGSREAIQSEALLDCSPAFREFVATECEIDIPEAGYNAPGYIESIS